MSSVVEGVSEANPITRDEHEHFTQSLVAAACRLVGSDRDVRGVHVLTPSRPTYDELFCYQEWARDHHVRLNVDGNCAVTVRPERDVQTTIAGKDLPT